MKLTPVASRDDGYDERPRIDENKSKRCVPGGISTTEVLVDVEPMAGNNVCWKYDGNQVEWFPSQIGKAPTQNHLQHGDSDGDQQINNHLTATLQER